MLVVFRIGKAKASKDWLLIIANKHVSHRDDMVAVVCMMGGCLGWV